MKLSLVDVLGCKCTNHFESSIVYSKLFASHRWWADSLYEKCKLKHLIVFILTSALPYVGP